MLKQLLMLKHLGIDGALINYIVNHFSEKDRVALFQGGAFDLQFKYNVFNDEHLCVFYDEDKLKKAEEFVNNLIYKSNEQGIKILSYYDSQYPSNLKAIKRCPLFVYVKGNLQNLNVSKTIACVGTRNPSMSALHSVNKIVKGLVEEGSIIISGLAKGIDAQSHKECLANGGKTIAVLAHGLDTIYPKENSQLAETILEQEGTLLSEYPLGIKGLKSNFVARNRIISGLSEGVIVFEAGEKSGTMHTARFAYTQGKKIFCPSVAEETQGLSSGVQKLITTGSAISIRNASDVIKYAFSSEKHFMSVAIESKLFKELENISNGKGIVVKDLINKIILNYIEGERRHE
ncbi:DNA-protecting protein DprA [Priestia megaterium]|uniref:DNA-processing protein DprA n=1 Tax=Priestia TaxID=2800373 RepID=UPI00196A5A1C|nr:MULTISPECIES: DNA-processing protein DprA [Priestia]MED3819020.1 DNA-processing protein DprA [Priestia aryabhattai]QSF34700.1 DNA-protecting protein DprA [Priestia megaterium]